MSREEIDVLYNCKNIADNFTDKLKLNFYESREKINERKMYIISHLKRTAIRFPVIEKELNEIVAKLTVL